MTSIALPLGGRPQLSRAEVYGARYLIAFAVTLASVLELVDTSIVNVATGAILAHRRAAKLTAPDDQRVLK